ncbi:MAG: hypothetical protein JWR84_2033 [Caulobacter sp.]|nr:hypothetical protein [Caulobacter sp.]
MRGAALALTAALVATPAAAADFRIFADDREGLGVVDLDSIVMAGTFQSFELVLIYGDGDGAVQVAMMPMQLSCGRRQFRANGPARGLDAQLKPVETHEMPSDWKPTEGSQMARVAAHICDGVPMPLAPGGSVQEVMDRRLARVPN